MTEPANGNGKTPEANEPAEAATPATEVLEPVVEPPKDPLAEANAQITKLRDQLLRTAADFDNYRKRARKDADDAQKKGTEELLKTLLPVFDNLERAMVVADQATDVKAIADGVKMVLKQFTDTLGRVGIKRVAGVGTAFDPTVHEAVQQIESADAAPGTVIAEVQPGYQMGERLVRAALVVVAKPPAAAKAEEPKAD
ncbi:MAG: nucleotide exchange factor GrpE [Polyangiales bacterium]